MQLCIFVTHRYSNLCHLFYLFFIFPPSALFPLPLPAKRSYPLPHWLSAPFYRNLNSPITKLEVLAYFLSYSFKLWLSKMKNLKDRWNELSEKNEGKWWKMDNIVKVRKTEWYGNTERQWGGETERRGHNGTRNEGRSDKIEATLPIPKKENKEPFSATFLASELFGLLTTPPPVTRRPSISEQ